MVFTTFSNDVEAKAQRSHEEKVGAKVTRPWRSMMAFSDVPPVQTSRPWRCVTTPTDSICFKQANSKSVELLPSLVPEEDTPSLIPAAQGSHKCYCRGEVLAMFGHYGWLAALDEIDHPAITKNNGRIYVHKRDVAGGLTLVEGDRVGFFLYVDDQGLGAEECHLMSWDCEDAQWSCNNRKIDATRSVSAWSSGDSVVAAAWNVNAAEFVPSKQGLVQAHAYQAAQKAFAVELSKSNVFMINQAYWSDDSDEDSSAVESEGDCHADVESDGNTRLVRRVRRDGARRCVRKSGSRVSCGSSSTGISSDSEIPDVPKVWPPVEGFPLDFSPPPGLLHPGLQPPPGLSLP